MSERARLMIVFPEPPVVYGGDHVRVTSSAVTEVDGLCLLAGEPFTGLVYGGSGTDVGIRAFEAGKVLDSLPDGVWGDRGLPWLWAKDRDLHDADHMVYWQDKPFTGTVIATDANGYVTRINEWVDGLDIASVGFTHTGKVTAIETGERTTADGRVWSNDLQWQNGTVIWARSTLWTDFSDGSRMRSGSTVGLDDQRKIKSLVVRGPYFDIVGCSEWDEAWVIPSPDSFQGMQAASDLTVSHVVDMSGGDRWLHSVMNAIAADGGLDKVETLKVNRNGLTAQQTVELLDLGWPNLRSLAIRGSNYGFADGYFGDYFRVVVQLKRDHPGLAAVVSDTWIAAENEPPPADLKKNPTIIWLDPGLNHVVRMDNPDRRLGNGDAGSWDVLDWLVAQPELKVVRLRDPATSHADTGPHQVCVERLMRIRPDVQLLIQ